MKSVAPDFGRIKEKYRENEGDFKRFYGMLLAANGRFNLTAVTEEKEVFHKHFLDSLAAEELFPHGASVAEVGSGGGFPSVPLMIVRRDLSFTLIESVGKKCEFLKEVVSALHLNADVRKIRAEEAGKDPKTREKFDVCCARAVAPLPALSEYCLPLVKKGGLFIAYKGVEEETKGMSLLGGGNTEIFRYELPEGYGSRTLIVTEKVRPTPSKYPRGRGAERKAPLWK